MKKTRFAVVFALVLFLAAGCQPRLAEDLGVSAWEGWMIKPFLGVVAKAVGCALAAIAVLAAVAFSILVVYAVVIMRRLRARGFPGLPIGIFG